jgi:hypothetical protein
MGAVAVLLIIPARPGAEFSIKRYRDFEGKSVRGCGWI